MRLAGVYVVNKYPIRGDMPLTKRRNAEQRRYLSGRATGDRHDLMRARAADDAPGATIFDGTAEHWADWIIERYLA